MNQPGSDEVYVVQAELLVKGAEYQQAANELAEIGITRPSPADVHAWLNATPRVRRRLITEWAFVSMLPDPSWKAR